jgi:choline-sulfatase
MNRAKLPNILFVMFDQMSSLSLPAYGHPVVRTPHLDALARRGTVFDAAYCASPLCSPSRFAMLTGLLPSRIGAYDNAAELPSSIPTVLHHLRCAGYRTCLSGKMDFAGADQLHGYEERLTTDLSPSDFGWTPDWANPRVVQPWYHSLHSVAEAGPCDYSLSLQYDEDACFKAIQWLHGAAGERDGGADDRPFMLTVSVMHPHDPYRAPRRFWDMYDPASIDMPAVPPPVRRNAVEERMYRLYDRCEVPISADDVRRARHAYYAMITYCDDLLGRLLATLETLGLADDTVIVVTADHGDMLGERGLWYKMTFYERAVRVPLIVAGPGLAAGQRIGPAVSHLDLLPTFLELAIGSPAAAGPCDGASLVPSLRHGAPPRGEVFGEYMAEGYDEPVVMCRRGDRKFVYSRGDGPTLFDLAADPQEMTDMAGRSDRVDEIAALVAEAESKWDLDRLHAAILDSQRRRRLVHEALTTGRLAPWDYAPTVDAAGSYWRNYNDGRPDPDRALRLPR